MQIYIDHLMACINGSRKIAENEFTIQSYGSISREEMREWYSCVLEWVNKNPPTFYVKYLEVTESYDLKITGINYVYYDKSELICEASIKVISDLYKS